ncbi:hypothetical protein A2V71_04690 [Candidatus Berkelbacteria bacterium RBG_13_40_8]|uniref:PurE domain-containing protein n=1 Tax=Candidatus Berkelbacteria bacterium RBG_13_40_8 TaxID=1797467 RepID=A0A1F5DMY6_9BACT|nr:MAG: hypothetical protein A2V71_04690 [Candidatus Berkelbacteria bacterium RBG_13_40_8]
MRRIAVIVGSKTDLKQCGQGLEYLRQESQANRVKLIGGILASSIHRATEFTLKKLRELHSSKSPPDVLITGAGWANHLTGMCDAYLRYTLGDTKIVVVGVAFEDSDNQNHTLASRLSISEVPKTQVVFSDKLGSFEDQNGFLRACRFAVNGVLPAIILPESRPPELLSLENALKEAL